MAIKNENINRMITLPIKFTYLSQLNKALKFDDMKQLITLTSDEIKQNS